MLDPFHSYSCPYCGTEQQVLLEPSAGRVQKFVTDCEICCRPIQIEVRFEGEEIIGFTAEVES